MAIPINSMTKKAAAQLSIIAYTDENDVGQQRTDMVNALKNIPADSNGPFTLLWGPANNNGILSYVAQAADGTLGVAFRGTVSSGGAIDVISNLVDDMLGVMLVPWQYPLSAGARVSWGMNTALALADSSTDPSAGTALLDFLRIQLEEHSSPIMVAGHSLGGALANLAAVWLIDQLPKAGGLKVVPPIVPFTFAAPTVTDSVFAKLFAQKCPQAYHCVNTTDVVPKAWKDIQGISDSFPGPGQSLWNYSILLYTAMKTASLAANGLDYVALPGTEDEFSGPSPASGTSYSTEAEAQHSMTTTYFSHVSE
jgi:hypothetical protein